MPTLAYFFSAVLTVAGIWFLCWFLMRGWLHILDVIERGETRRLGIVREAEQTAFHPKACSRCRAVGHCHPACAGSGLGFLDKMDGVA